MVRHIGWLVVVAALSACASAPLPNTPVAAAPACDCPPPEPMQCPEPAPLPLEQPPPLDCPPPPACPKLEAPAASAARPGDKTIFGEMEMVEIQPGSLRLEGRIDSGAKTSSLHALSIVRFERDGRRWVRFETPTGRGDEVATLELPWERRVKIKGVGEDYEERPVVDMEVRIGTRRQRIHVTLTDRGNYEFPVLIGRNFLRDNALVDVSRTYVHGKK